MNKISNVKITFCFPQISSKNRTEFITDLVRDVRLDKKVGYAGYLKKNGLQKYLSDYFDRNNIKKYVPLPITSKKEIEKTIRLIVQKCLTQLPLPALSVYIFPWLGEKYSNIFGGVNGFAPYEGTIHLFISQSKFSIRSLNETTVHEFSHALFFHYRKSSLRLTLLEAFIFEGLAENFREDVVGGKPAPWSHALSEKQCKLAFSSLINSLNSKNHVLYQNVFFGAEKYKRWTGYSIGYRIVKSFRKAYPDKSWSDIMKMKPETIFTLSNFI